MFFFVFLGVLSLIYGFVGYRLIVPAGLKLHWRLSAWMFLFVTLTVVPMLFLLRRSGIETFWIDLAAWAGYISLGFVFLLFSFLVIRDTSWIAVWALKKCATVISGLFRGGVASAPTDRARRRFLLNSMNAGILAGTSGLTGYGIYEARRVPKIEEIAVPFDNLPADLAGFRIVQLTDIHVSSTVKRGWVETVVRQVNGLAPDLVALTGDLVDGSVNRLRGDVAPLSDISAPFGKWFVTGNHEYYSGVEAWLDEIRRLGFNPLINEHTVIKRGSGKILLGGVTDFSAGRRLPEHVSSPEKAIAGAPETDLGILLAHQPKSVFDAARAGFDLQISGHTHGGQLFPWNFVVGLDQPFVSGLHEFDGMKIYVSRGTGYWGPPIRLGAQSEITLLKLVSASGNTKSGSA